jgi:hypothetical protein
VRYLEISLQHENPVVITDGTFDEAGIDTAFASGTVFYSVGGNPPITDLAGTVNPDDTAAIIGSDASLVTVGDVETLTLPFSMSTFSLNESFEFLRESSCSV